MQQASFLQTQTILRALEYALSKGGFGSNSTQKKTAASLIKEMKGGRTASGRQQLLIGILGKGATVEEMMKAAGASRRTVFRYLNGFEDAGIDISLSGGKYRLK